MVAATKGIWTNVNPVSWPKGISVLLNSVLRGRGNEAFFCVQSLINPDGSKARKNYRARFYITEADYVAQRKLALKSLADWYGYKRVPTKWIIVAPTFKDMLKECHIRAEKRTYTNFEWIKDNKI